MKRRGYQTKLSFSKSERFGSRLSLRFVCYFMFLNSHFCPALFKLFGLQTGTNPILLSGSACKQLCMSIV